MKNIYLLILFVFFFGRITTEAQVAPKAHWEKYSGANGLVTDYVQDVLIESPSDVWIATNSGLSHFDGTAFTNYYFVNSNLNDFNILELELAQNLLWLRTSSGISSFDGVSFTNYTTSNGLLSNDIQGITSTSTDTLWMVSLSGTSKYDGTSFTHYPSRTGRDIEVDSSDNLYVLRYSVANNFAFAYLYSNGVWSTPTPTGGVTFASSINPARLEKTKDNNLFIVSGGIGSFHVKVTYPLLLERQEITLNNQIQGNGSTNLSAFEQVNGVKWVGAGRNSSAFLLAGQDSVFTNQYIANIQIKPTCIDIEYGIMVVGTEEGVYISTPVIKNGQDRVSLSVNEITTSVKITDPIFSNFETFAPNFEFPKNSGLHGIFSANFIVQAKKVTQTNYNVHPVDVYSPSLIPGPISNVGGLSANYIVKVSAQEIASHRLNHAQPNYVLPSGIEEWPAFGDTTLGMAKDLAPFMDVNANGCYDPENGDYPVIRGDEAIYWINHPDDRSLKLEYHWMMYAYNPRADTALQQSIFVHYTIINRDSVAYDSIKVGLYVDGDLGNPSDDYVGTDSANSILYFYNGEINDRGASGFGNRTPALGIKFLGDKLKTSMYFNVGQGVTGSPLIAAHWQEYLNARWKNGQWLRYGGNGYSGIGVTSTRTRYFFTGNPYLQTGWTEVTPGVGAASFANASGDRRVLGSIDFFPLQPNERKAVEIAVGYGVSADTTSSIGQNISKMLGVLNNVNNFWSLLTTPPSSFATTDSCNVITSIEKASKVRESNFKVYPIPTTRNLTVESDKVIVEIQLIDMKGALVRSFQPNQKRFKVELEGQREGFYMLRARDSKNGWESKKIILTK